MREGAEKARHASEKAAKAEFKAREARRKAECVARGLPYTKGKFVPPGYFDVKPSDWPTEQRAADMRPRAPRPYFAHPHTREVVGTSYGPEADLQPDERAQGGGLYPQLRPQQPQYRVVELRDAEYGEPWHSRDASGPKEERLIGAENARESTEAWRQHKAQLMQRKSQADAQLRELASREHEHAARFRDITERERQLRLAEEREMERRAEIRRQRAELKLREQQLKERETARDYYLKEEREAEQEAAKYRKTAAAGDRSKLDALGSRKHELEKELEQERHFLSQTKTQGEADVARMEKIRGIEANLAAQRNDLDKELRQLRMREHEHAEKVEALRARERMLDDEEKRLRAEQAAKEKRAELPVQRDVTAQKAAVNAEYDELKKRRAALDQAEKDAEEKQKKLHREIQDAEKEREHRRAEAEKAAMEREKVTSQKPVVPAKDLQESVQSGFQYQRSTEQRNAEGQEYRSAEGVGGSSGGGGTGILDKARRGFEQLKEKVKGPSTSASAEPSGGHPGAPDKDSTANVERTRVSTARSPAPEQMSTQSQRVSQQHEDTSTRAHMTRDIHVRHDIGD